MFKGVCFASAAGPERHACSPPLPPLPPPPPVQKKKKKTNKQKRLTGADAYPLSGSFQRQPAWRGGGGRPGNRCGGCGRW